MRNLNLIIPNTERHPQLLHDAAGRDDQPGALSSTKQPGHMVLTVQTSLSDKTWGRAESGGGRSHPAKYDSDAFITKEAQLILAEKRTSLAAMRTGIAVFAIPLSILGLLIATSKYYDMIHVMHLILPLAVMLVALIALGFYLVVRAILHIRKYDHLIMRLKHKQSRMADFLE